MGPVYGISAQPGVARLLYPAHPEPTRDSVRTQEATAH